MDLMDRIGIFRSAGAAQRPSVAWPIVFIRVLHFDNIWA